MKRILTYGTFDLLHYGHIELIRRAKEHGDYLIVGLSTDEFNEEKGKKSVVCYWERRKILEALIWVDEVIPEYSWGQKLMDIEENKIDVLIMGDDWKGHFDHLPCEVIYLPRTPEISTTKRKEEIKNGCTHA